MIKVKRAVISVSLKKGVTSFAKGLASLGVEIISTGGTAAQLRESGVPVTEVSEYTGFPEMMNGRVKTLHPKIHAGLLAVRENADHMEQARKNGIGLIDMVVVNFYPFENVTGRKNVSWDEAIENIDVGGPTLLRSAAKNYKSVAVICSLDRYEEILRELQTNNGLLSDAVLFSLAVEAFAYMARYDEIISGFFKKRLSSEEMAARDDPQLRGFSPFPRELTLRFTKVQDLRYGENPHQPGALYRNMENTDGPGLTATKQIHGKELSFNNILDINAAVEFIKDSQNPAAVIIKHSNPTGIAEDKTLDKAYHQAWRCDPESAFGGIIGLNQTVDLKTAQQIAKSGFMECVIAPGFEPKALDLLKQKKNFRILELNFEHLKEEEFDFKKIAGGILWQGQDARQLRESDCKVVTRKKPTRNQMRSLLFGWQVVKDIKSNAIVLVKGTKTVGIGAGQTSRIESIRMAVEKAGPRARGAVLASDAFLPKIDNIKLAAKAGVTAVIQTGGSVADAEVIKAADKAGIAMIMTGVRHFKH